METNQYHKEVLDVASVGHRESQTSSDQESVQNQDDLSFSSHQVRLSSPSPRAIISRDNDTLTSTPKPVSRARKVLQIFLFPFQLLATCVTIPVCSIIYAAAGLGIGFTLGSGWILKPAYTGSGLKLAIAASVLALPAGILIGAGLSFIGLFWGIYNGAQMPWDKAASLINTSKKIEQHIDSFFGVKRYQPTVPTQDLRTSSNDSDIPSSPTGRLLSSLEKQHQDLLERQNSVEVR